MDTQPSSPEVSSSSAGTQDPQPSSAVPASAAMGKGIAVLAVAGVLMGAGAVALVMARAPRATAAPSPTTVDPRASAPVTRSIPAVPSESTPTSPSPNWSGGVERVGRRTHIVFFELAAENEISMWTRRVRPVLSVRCVGGSTEVYVLTEAAASLEENRETHTVSLAFDADEPLKEAWFPSDDYQALFSPDAVTLARRIAAARTLRFGFTPYNAAPAVARFNVRGFDAHIGEIAKSCRWKS